MSVGVCLVRVCDIWEKEKENMKNKKMWLGELGYVDKRTGRHHTVVRGGERDI